MNKGNYMTAEEIAKLLDVSYGCVMQHINAGDFGPTVIFNDSLAGRKPKVVAADAVRAYLDDPNTKEIKKRVRKSNADMQVCNNDVNAELLDTMMDMIDILEAELRKEIEIFELLKRFC